MILSIEVILNSTDNVYSVQKSRCLTLIATGDTPCPKLISIKNSWIGYMRSLKGKIIKKLYL